LVANKLKEKGIPVNIGKVDCTVDHPNPICGEYADGYPSLRYFPSGEKIPGKTDGNSRKY